jgi:hypothetical protein
MRWKDGLAVAAEMGTSGFALSTTGTVRRMLKQHALHARIAWASIALEQVAIIGCVPSPKKTASAEESGVASARISNVILATMRITARKTSPSHDANPALVADDMGDQIVILCCILV